MKDDRDERTIKEIIEYLKKQNGNCSNELSNVEGLCLVKRTKDLIVNSGLDLLGSDKE